MENSYLSGKSEFESQNSVTRCNDSSSLVDQISVDKLSDGVDKLNFSGGNLSNDTNMESYIEEYEERGEVDGLSDEELMAQMGYAKSTPEKDIRKEPQSQRQYDQMEEKDGLSEKFIVGKMDHRKEEAPTHKLTTIPNATANVVSALKGSRVRDGNPVKNCRVSWAPDVYDPTPTPPEHFATSTNERHENDHKVMGGAARNKRKGGGKRSGSSEDGGRGKGAVKCKDDKQFNKKHGKKHGGNSSRHRGSDEY